MLCKPVHVCLRQGRAMDRELIALLDDLALGRSSQLIRDPSPYGRVVPSPQLEWDTLYCKDGEELYEY